MDPLPAGPFGVTDGGGNIFDDPMFVSPGSDDFRLAFDSPCIDRGNPDETVIMADIFDVDQDDVKEGERTPDLDFLPRVVGARVDMGPYENTCPEDLDGDGAVAFGEILVILTSWGSCPIPPDACRADLNASGAVDFGDILIVLGSWGPCPGTSGPEPDAPQEVVECMGLEWPDDWDEFLDKMENGTPAEQDNYRCWIDHYYERHCLGSCLCLPNCPDDDPWGNH